ncbi:hypothetical protein C8R43DRAFT_945161 [Mycena crocata]|nr:hypothetical protein C8R43DRAFT_945161 [Mycena crocata]
MSVLRGTRLFCLDGTSSPNAVPHGGELLAMIIKWTCLKPMAGVATTSWQLGLSILEILKTICVEESQNNSIRKAPAPPEETISIHVSITAELHKDGLSSPLEKVTRERVYMAELLCRIEVGEAPMEAERKRCRHVLPWPEYANNSEKDGNTPWESSEIKRSPSTSRSAPVRSRPNAFKCGVMPRTAGAGELIAVQTRVCQIYWLTGNLEDARFSVNSRKPLVDSDKPTKTVLALPVCSLISHPKAKLRDLRSIINHGSGGASAAQSALL